MSVTVSFEEVAARLKPQADTLIAQYEDSRSALLPLAYVFQDEEGYVSPAALEQIAQWLGLPLAVVESTVSFYTLLFRRPVGRYMLQVCRNLACTINGAEEIMRHFRERLGIGHLETTADGLFSYEEVECLAACDRAPCMQVNLEFVFDLTPALVDEMLAAMRGGTYAVPPLAQTLKPERGWLLPKDMKPKSPGAQAVSNPNAPGGIADRSGVIMLDRIVHDISPQRSRERSVVDGKALLERGLGERGRGEEAAHGH
ncbi:MAG: NAD(P)H-dependent oxidoreductase subunit E [Candidatus Eremiobacteraeota bacterium]|nr:NAD(P)H-dependent oxidoreductase subunit E [Candidatus Eremiobacteraeota bacterium]MBV8355928.1 NAD(P)H-dependent oxidoreductase subunit E [Candidatus Eremiobacteraeota bacterium]